MDPIQNPVNSVANNGDASTMAPFPRNQFPQMLIWQPRPEAGLRHCCRRCFFSRLCAFATLRVGTVGSPVTGEFDQLVCRTEQKRASNVMNE